jgi:NAD(P)-dependent dehydrogenase (short-subunit alcohol dehydrogenase family)
MTSLFGNILVQGASRGIGLAMVEELLAEQQVDTVIATARSATTSESLQSLRQSAGERLLCLDMDITREHDIQNTAKTLKNDIKRLHGVINVAGILHDASTGMSPEKRVEDLDPAHLDTAFRVNCQGPMLVAKHCFALLRHDQPAFFASLSARVGSISDNHLGGWYSYRASKAAQNQFTRTFAVEARRRARNLRVLALHPGTTDTRLSSPFQRNVPAEKLFSADFVARRLLNIVRDTSVEDSGRFLDWDNQEVPW